MELIRKSLNAPVSYTTMYHSGQKMHISVLNGALWDIGLVHCAICEFKSSSVKFIHKSHNAPVHIPQFTIQNKDLHISVLNGAL